MVEQRTENPRVASSILALGTSKTAFPLGRAVLLSATWARIEDRGWGKAEAFPHLFRGKGVCGKPGGFPQERGASTAPSDVKFLALGCLDLRQNNGYIMTTPGCGLMAKALALGARDCEFESHHPDQILAGVVQW